MIRIDEKDSFLNGYGSGSDEEFYKVELKDLFNMEIACGSIPGKETAMSACVPYLIKNKIYDCEVLVDNEDHEICYFGGYGFTEKTARIFEWMIGKNGGSLRSDDVNDSGLCTFESE